MDMREMIQKYHEYEEKNMQYEAKSSDDIQNMLSPVAHQLDPSNSSTSKCLHIAGL